MTWFKVLAISFVVLLLGMLFLGWLNGFPWEKQKAIENIKDYVKLNYDVTPTDIKVFLTNFQVSTGVVYSDELPYCFEVFIKREDLSVYGDLYSDALIEYNLEKFIQKDIEDIKDVEVMVRLEGRLVGESVGLSVEEIKSNPEMIFQMPQIEYNCIVNINDFDCEKAYSVFKVITKKLQPTNISFRFFKKDGYVVVSNDEFEGIHNYDYFKRLIG